MSNPTTWLIWVVGVVGLVIGLTGVVLAAGVGPDEHLGRAGLYLAGVGVALLLAGLVLSRLP